MNSTGKSIAVVCTLAAALLLKLDQSSAQMLTGKQSEHSSDAPKYYHLNELLHKTSDSNDGERIQRTIPSPQEAALGTSQLEGATEREGSSIDTLIRSMRRRGIGSSDMSDFPAADADADNPIAGNKDVAAKEGRKAITRMDAPADAAAHEVQRSNEPIPTSSRLSRSRRGNGKC